MQVGLVGQRGNERATAIVADLLDHLEADGVAVRVEDTTADALAERPTEAAVEAVPVGGLAETDLVVSVGGDGTFLYAAHAAGTTPLMGVNLGEVGFLNVVDPAGATEAVMAEVARIRETGEASTHSLPRLAVEGEDWSLAPAINEIVIQGPRRGRGGGVTVDVRVDGDPYTRDHADGVLVATTTGSTAYNLSEGGPLVHPEVDGVVVTELCRDRGMPPLVVDAGRTISVHVSDAPAAEIVSDGRDRATVSPPGRIRVRRAGEPIRLAGPRLEFFAALDKLA